MKIYGIKTLGVRNYIKILPDNIFKWSKKFLYDYFHVLLLVLGLYILYKTLT